MFTNHKLHGTTLIELVITIVLLSIITIVSAQLLSAWFSAFNAGQQMTDTYWQGNIVFQRLSNDLASIASPSAIRSANPGDISFIDNLGNTLSYRLEKNQVVLTYNNSDEVLANQIAHLSFQYLDKNGLGVTQTLNTRYVVFEFSLLNTKDIFSTIIAVRNTF